MHAILYRHDLLSNQAFDFNFSTSRSYLISSILKEIKETHMNLLHIFIRSNPIPSTHILSFHSKCQILSHDSINIDNLYTSFLQRFCELSELGGIV